MAGCNPFRQEELAIFPRTEETWVGDPMPYYDGKSFRVFYLEDLRDRDVGFHPWSLLTTDDFVDYKYEGIVIPYAKDPDDQELALGTGSVVKDHEGLYHAFYTGHNPRKDPKEAIMHATSKDLKVWKKIPEDTFFGSGEYERNDFRDPYVFYNGDDNQYWMLITTRKNHKGVIALYTSTDLKYWSDKGVFFENDMGTDSNLECPTLIKYGDYWYLSFSDQWPDRVVHYRIADNSKGPFTKPKLDHFDGNGFYAGRLEKDKDNLYLFGWTPTKDGYDDTKNYNWAGNLVVHQLKQKKNGELYPVPVERVVKEVNNHTNLVPINQSKTVTATKNHYTFSGKGLEAVTFPEMNGTNKLTGTIKTNASNQAFGFMFNVRENDIAPLNIVLDAASNELKFFNVPTDRVDKARPESVMPLAMKDNGTIDFTLLIDDTVAVLYVNDQVVLSTRMFSIQNNQWGIFSINSDVAFENIKLSKLKE
jgi:beta-fructofuranosidase